MPRERDEAEVPECPECGHEGPHEQNEGGDMFSCTECGTCFEATAGELDDCDEYLEIERTLTRGPRRFSL